MPQGRGLPHKCIHLRDRILDLQQWLYRGQESLKYEGIATASWSNRRREHKIPNTVIAIRNLPIRTVQEGVRIFYTDHGSIWGFAHPFINETWECLNTSADIDQRHQCARNIGNFLYDNYADMPMFMLNSDVAVDPRYTADYVWPGLTSAGISHFHNIKGVRE